MTCNILIGCDQSYYDDWGKTLLKSIFYFNPWIKLHAHIVNPNNLEKLDFVDYTTETLDFPNDTVKIGYLQCCRFLAVSDKFKNNEFVMTVDADSICTKEFTEESFKQVSRNITVLHHPKDDRWLAGLVTYGVENFRHEYAKQIRKKPLELFAPFHDQTVLDDLSKDYNFVAQEHWMSIGKHKNQSVFLTLKGNQKYKDKYLQTYNKINDTIKYD